MKKYPFKFLDAYNKEDTGIFFGRDEEIKALYEMVFQSPILLVYGASGTGKTSLIQCGLASKFQSHDWLALTVRRGADINANLDKALADAGGNVPAEQDNMDWLKEVTGDMDEADNSIPLTPLEQTFKAIYLKSFKPIYLIFDQFEELFILGNETEQKEFIKTINGILKIKQPVKMIFSMREEYLGHLYGFEQQVPQLLRKKLRVEPMNLEKVEQVIVGATSYKDANVRLATGREKQIAEGIFKKLKNKEKSIVIELPYLQVFLDKLYMQIAQDETRQREALITEEDLKKTGDIGDILQDFLNEQVSGISKKLLNTDAALTEAVIWSILSPFVTIEGTKEPIEKTVLYDKLPAVKNTSVDIVIEEFMNGRILRYNEDVDMYELAHDALAKRVAEKRSDEEIALLEVKRLIKTQSSLTGAARATFSEKQLNFIDPFIEKLKLTPGELTLIADSRREVLKTKEIERDRLAAERKQQLLKGYLVWIGLAAVLMLGLAIWAFSQRQAAVEAIAKERDAEILARKNFDKANKLVDAFYFYDGKLALASKKVKYTLRYGFINKDANVVIDYKYSQADQFDDSGFAKVKKEDDNGNKVSYFIDTAGTEYKAAYKLNDLNSQVVAFDMDGQALPAFPQKVVMNPQLQILNLNNNSITTIPGGIGNLKKLKSLSLSENNINAMPAEIAQLSSLEKLDLSNNNLKSLPPEIGQLRSLMAINLTGNSLTGLEPAISRIKDLHILNLNNNELKGLPKEIGRLKNLVYLALDKNQLKALPDSITEIKGLMFLNLEANRLKGCIPASVLQLKKLLNLNLAENQLDCVPQEISHLSNLKNLDLHLNKLTTLPDQVWDLKELVFLNLKQNKLTSIPDKIKQLTKLKLLYVKGNLIPEANLLRIHDLLPGCKIDTLK